MANSTSRTRRMTAAQRRAMFARLQSEGKAISQHEGLVRAATRRYRGQSNYDDLVQEGRIGLLEALRKHDPKKGAFSTYATRRIKARVQRGLGKGFQVRVPERKLKTVEKPKVAAMSELFQVETGGGISQAHARASVAALRRRIDRLPGRQRDVLVARYFSDHHARPEPWTTRKVAKKLKITQGRVSQLEKSAKSRLQKGT